MSSTSKIIVFEGLKDSGKTSMAKRLSERLNDINNKIIHSVKDVRADDTWNKVFIYDGLTDPSELDEINKKWKNPIFAHVIRLYLVEGEDHQPVWKPILRETPYITKKAITLVNYDHSLSDFLDHVVNDCLEELDVQ